MIDPEQAYVSAAGYMYDKIMPLFLKALDVESGAYHGLMKKTKMKTSIGSYDKLLAMAQSAYNSIKDLHIRNDDGFEEKVENMYSEFIATVTMRKEAVQCLLNGNTSDLDILNAASKNHLNAFNRFSDQVFQMVRKN